jgi:VCBS repeat-containing protein
MKKIFIAYMLILAGFVAVATTVQAEILSAPDTTDSARVAISPYAQSVPSDSYTFIGVSHPSLDSALTQIGVVLEVLGMTTVTDDAAGRSTTFTVDAGETHRVFIVDQSNTSINTLNSAFTDARTHLIKAQDSAQFGSVRIVGINEAPGARTLVGSTAKYDNVSQLNMWGVVYIPSSGTGFAMEFIGDAHDSTIGPVSNGIDPSGPRVFTGAGRGIN